jgi:hypothetical protein
MSYDDKGFMALGRLVRHRFDRARGGKCVRCGTKRRWRGASLQWCPPGGEWTENNPPCVQRQKERG